MLEYLNDLDALKTHLRRRTEGMSTKDKGDIFATLVQHIFTLSSEYRDFTQPKANPKSGSHDLGTDLKAINIIDSMISMHVQCRWSLDRTDDIDSILGKFMTYAEPETDAKKKNTGQNLSLFPQLDNKNHYMIASLDRLDTLLKEYEKQSNRPTLAFYTELKTENRLHIIDGNTILELLKAEWLRYSQTKLSTSLESVTDNWLHWKNVYIGVISGEKIQGLYSKFGRSIFFDNIRDYLGGAYQGGDDVDSVNDAIMQTVIQSPDKMLARNNGIVIRATGVSPDGSLLGLDNMSIVNGCQTTMSIVNSGENAKNCQVLVKVVSVTSDRDHWDITRTANMQNEVSRIELDLAQWLRPQVVMRAALQQDKPFDGDDVFSFFGSLNRTRVQYENIRAMFIGLFSVSPYNIIKRDRNLIQMDLVKGVYEKDPQGQNLFRVLFDIHNTAQRSNERIETIFSGTENLEVFSRFLDENKGFISYLAVLATCAATKIDISKVGRNRIEEAVEKMNEFLRKVDELQKSLPEILEDYHISAFQATTNLISNKLSEVTTSRIRQHMALTLERANFTNLINQTESMYRFRNQR